jgi:hypothetical protein
MLSCLHFVRATNHLLHFCAVVYEHRTHCTPKPNPHTLRPTAMPSQLYLFFSLSSPSCLSHTRCSFGPPPFPAPDVTQDVPLLKPLGSLYIGANCRPTSVSSCSRLGAGERTAEGSVTAGKCVLLPRCCRTGCVRGLPCLFVCL